MKIYTNVRTLQQLQKGYLQINAGLELRISDSNRRLNATKTRSNISDYSHF